MPTTTPATKELERLAGLLNRSLSARQYDDAQRFTEECVALCDAENYEAVLAVLERARRIAIIQRSLAAGHIDGLRRASAYLRNAQTF